MTDKESADKKARAFFDDLWSGGDFWAIESSPYESGRHAALAAAVSDSRYGRTLEIGCGAGAFTRRLTDVSDEVLGLDISEAAIRRARDAGLPTSVRLEVANVIHYDLRAAPPWDLVVMAETIYYLGWLYPFFDVAWLASELFLATAPGGRLLLSNTEGECDDPLIRPWLIRSYHDLFRNVGFAVERESVWTGTKDGVEMNVRITLFTRPT